MKLATVKPKIKPEEGEYRIVIKFAWWPRVVENKKIWLERYKIISQYTVRERLVPLYYSGQVLKLVFGGWDFITEQLIKKQNMQGEVLPKFENAPPPPQRKRRSKDLRPHDVWPHIQKWPLEDRIKLWAELKDNIDTEIKSIEVKAEQTQAQLGAFKEAMK